MNSFDQKIEKAGEFGIATQIKFPIVVVSGLPGARIHEIVEFETGEEGEVFTLDRDYVQVLLFSKKPIKVGIRVIPTGRFLSMPVGEELLGKIFDPLGNTISDGKTFEKPKEMREVDAPPPGIDQRVRITKAFETGVSMVDMMVPLGRGQKELIIGDRKTGKTSFLLSVLKNQIQKGTRIVYCAIGKKKSDIKKVYEYFKNEKLEDKVVIVATTSYDSPSLIYVTPFSAMTVAEYFRDKGEDTLVVFDDLSTHAKFYRELSLIARRFPGRDSYPGDIFHTHARLLERAGNFKHSGEKEVSITALPVVEIVEGDFTGYIATNLMGITDGHIYFDSNIYYQGRRPAINIGLSVTRVGRQAQSNLVRSINRELLAFFALHEKMQEFSHFGAELTDSVKQVIKTGEVLYNFFAQPSSQVIPLPVQVVMFAMLWLKVFDNSTFDDLTQAKENLMKAYEEEENKKLLDEIIKVDSLNQLLGNIDKKREELIKLCGIQKN